MRLVHRIVPGAGFAPFTHLERELNRFLGSGSNVGSPVDAGAVAVPATDIREDDKQFVFAVELPGIRREDVQVTLHEGVLGIAGERRQEPESVGDRCHCRERFVGRFGRRFELGVPVAADGIRASFRDGVLTVTVPKAEAARPKPIEVTVE